MIAVVKLVNSKWIDLMKRNFSGPYSAFPPVRLFQLRRFNDFFGARMEFPTQADVCVCVCYFQEYGFCEPVWRLVYLRRRCL